MGVILNRNILYLLDSLDYLTQRNRTADSRHILKTNLVSPSLYKLFSQVNVILHGMHRRIGNAERSLCYHPSLMSIAYGWDYVTGIVKSAEDTGNIRPLCLLYLIEKLT